MRLLIFAFLAYILYRVLRKYLQPGPKEDRVPDGGSVDEMVQDPLCKTFISRRGAKKKVVGDKEFFFCSWECAEKFENERKS